MHTPQNRMNAFFFFKSLFLLILVQMTTKSIPEACTSGFLILFQLESMPLPGDREAKAGGIKVVD